MAITYNVVEIEDFDADAATVAALDAIGATDWLLVDITYKPNEETGKSTALCIFKK
jgi:hypothetical protein